MPTPLFCLHALGSSSREFVLLRDLVGDDLQLIALDLPGFGESRATSGTTVEEMSAQVEEAIRSHGATEWALLGHSMGGKVAAVVAGRTMNGSNGLFGLRAVVLLAASPLSPEPMSEERRQSMLSWARVGTSAQGADGDGDLRAIDLADAEEFITANTASPLPPERRAAAVADVRRASPVAWTAWLRNGSREDWSGQFDPNPVPTLVLAGAEDGDLNAEAQRRLTLPMWPAGELQEVPGAAHLLPWERPEDVAAQIQEFWNRRVRTGPSVPADWGRLIASDRVSARTRQQLALRGLPDDPARAPRVLTDEQLRTLRVLSSHVVPQPGAGTIDLALRVDDQLADGGGDGWRPDGSPPDLDSYRAALDELHAAAAGTPEEFSVVLDEVVRGTRPTTGPLGPEQLAAWLEDATVDLVRQWLAHPATMAGLDYDGFATGGDGEPPRGFDVLDAGTREAWEPGPPRRLPLEVVGPGGQVGPTQGAER